MTCTCGAETRVLETRPVSQGIRRRRICQRLDCGQKFSTVELRVASMEAIGAAVREIGELIGERKDVE